MTHWVISCEHASNRIAKPFASVFQSKAVQQTLLSHRGWDLGASAVAKYLAAELKAPLHLGTMSRLLIDLNRSDSHPQLFSNFSQRLSVDKQQELLKYHRAFRDTVEQSIRCHSAPCTHLSIHSFVPRFKGQTRSTDIGLLYDPKRKEESDWARTVTLRLKQESELTIHRNSPYRGSADGMTTHLRKSLLSDVYLGIEVEINQRLLVKSTGPKRIAELLLNALKATKDS